VEHIDEVLKIALVTPPVPQQQDVAAPAAALGSVQDGMTH
jgi:hypothetical protein